ncbi:aspartate aminotransferase family protein [Dongia sp.]|uniref:aspartate aminotransferase family protein n=1 Tax=Dongia sp. TaxID=1977262 RepID=UPI0035AF139E
MSHVLHRDLKHALPKAVKGEGAYIFDSTGKKYLDASGGPAVSCLGHSHPKVIEAVRRQVGEIAFAYSAFFTHDAIEQLADKLVSQAPAGLTRAFFVSGGSEASEAAMKLARQYFLEIGQPQRRHFIARERSYHGNTLGALSLGHDFARRQTYEPLLLPVTHIAPCYEYRERRADESVEAYGRRVADELETAILKIGPDQVAAFFAEPVAGSSLGCAEPVPGYLARLREICDRYGVLLVFDEVMCGMGRTGHLFTCAEDNVVPDILTMAKGLGAGYQPIGAFLAHDKIVRALEDGSGQLKHGHTYAGHTMACAAALAVQEVFQEENLIPRVRDLGAKLRARLDDSFGQHPHIGDIRGRGLFIGLEMVADRETKQAFDPGEKKWLKLRQAAMSVGLICYPAGGCIDGRSGDHILLAPPFNLADSQLDEIVDKLGQALKLTVG